jgi:hypothetical protein
VKATGHKWDADGVCENCREKQADTLKFELSVSSVPTSYDNPELDDDDDGKWIENSGNVATKVTAEVYDDYSFIVTMPKDGSDWVNTSNVTVEATMKDVASLEVYELRSHEVKVTTGMTSEDVDLVSWLANCYSFEDQTVTVKIDGKECEYTFAKTGDIITGTPTDVEDTRTAWQALTGKVTTTTQKDDNSYILIKNGSYLQIGTEKMEFENASEDLRLDDFSQDNLSTLVGNIKNNVKLTTGLDDSKNVTAVLKAGTTLAVGESIAELKTDAKIVITGLDLTKIGGRQPGEDVVGIVSKINLSNALSELRTAVNGNTKVLENTVLDLVCAFDALVGAVDNGTDVTVTITFGEF